MQLSHGVWGSPFKRLSTVFAKTVSSFLEKVRKQSFTLQRSKFAEAFAEAYPFYSICLGNKNAEAVKFLEIKKK